MLECWTYLGGNGNTKMSINFHRQTSQGLFKLSTTSAVVYKTTAI